MTNNFNEELIQEIKISFKFAVSKNNNNRSSHKVNNIHNTIAKHLEKLLGSEYNIVTETISKTTHNKKDKNTKIKGRYNEKKVDIAIKRKHDNKIISGIGIKFPLSSFQKNKNNYFENMLGETANIRSNNIPYFQIMILLQQIPNFSSKKGPISFTIVDDKLMENYVTLSKDNITSFFHSPLKTLILILKDNIKKENQQFKDQQEYSNFYNNNPFTFTSSEFDTIKFDSGVILNEYSSFIEKISYLIKGFQ
ncbi:hypothetical protein J8J04_01785 ['Fragaria x ananassa' phyllody phytoplasma]|uniref:Restriction endonuclease n=1 Tax='Fragaria x ananassa' phyllody phytoplasma TaxID=2358428 RepID=A0ABS5K3V6_9MOLU|nr:hypothetical protein ['Fragaria x ananassa' phyllody phytoplasma]MBS2126414.1 hypothetical protein ['Fragaria x ananassa' phyllody phytoplasma]